MATTLTQEDLEQLEEAIAKGVKRVKYTDKEIEYRSIDEMFKVLKEIKKCLGVAPCGGGRKFANHSKGLC